jgi:hypothetical protein
MQSIEVLVSSDGRVSTTLIHPWGKESHTKPSSPGIVGYIERSAIGKKEQPEKGRFFQRVL